MSTFTIIDGVIFSLFGGDICCSTGIVDWFGKKRSMFRYRNIEAMCSG